MADLDDKPNANGSAPDELPKNQSEKLLLEAELKNTQWAKEFQLKRVDLWAKFFIPLITVIVGFCQFSKQQTANEELRFSAELWIRQHQMYSEITEAIGAITMQIELKHSHADLKNAIEGFKKAYWKSTLIEDASITDSLVAYNATLDRYLDIDLSNKAEREYQISLLSKLPIQGENLIHVLSQSLTRKSLKDWNRSKPNDTSHTLER
jgi:hypothetical protein